MQKAHSFYAVGFVFGVLMSEGTKKKTRSFYAAGLLFTSTGNRVPFRPLPWQPIDGGLLPPSRFPYCLHCKNAANSAPQKLIRISHSEPCSIQMMRITVTQNVMAISDFCDIALAPLLERR